MTIKLKQINISGLRGVKELFHLELNEKSILLYGDNGTGKSSISDTIEWYYTDNVSHLSISEIDLKEALRNSYLESTQPSSISIHFNKSALDSERKLFFKKDKLEIPSLISAISSLSVPNKLR